MRDDEIIKDGRIIVVSAVPVVEPVMFGSVMSSVPDSMNAKA
ncbi:MAG: hypothetical protein ACR2H4_09740 [Pyrinomonadaceae bacterium]